MKEKREKRDNRLYLTGCGLAAGMAVVFAISQGLPFDGTFAWIFWFFVIVFGMTLTSWFGVGLMIMGVLLMILEKL